MNALTHPLQLLVIDDDDVDRERVLRFLARSQLPIVATEASSGAQALHLVRTLHFDCIVLDNQLGDTTGTVLLRELQALKVHLCPVIMVTGAGSEALVVQTLQEGAADYLPKLHLNPDNLSQAILRSVENHQVQRERDKRHKQLERRVEDQAAIIRQRERDLQDILDHSSSLIGYCDTAQRVRFGNRAHQSWFGLPPHELPGRHVREVMGEALYAQCLPHIEGALTGEPQHFEQQLPGQGELPVRHVQVQYRPDLDEHGQVLGFYITIADVTPAKAAQLHIEELLRFMKAVIDKAPVGMAVYKSDGHCVLTNTAMAGIVGARAEDILQQTLWSLTRNQTVNLAVTAQATLADGRTRYINQTLHPSADRTVQVAWALARVERGADPYLVAIARDITEQQALHESLVNARNTAEEAVRIKSAFLANMSHEIRTPMNAIVGLSRLVLEAPLPAHARDQIDRVHESALALMGILDDILDYSKVEAGQLHLEHLIVPVEDTLQRVSDLFAGRMAQKRIAFTIDLPPEVPDRIMGDPLRLSQILNNLVGNAVKFTEQGSIHLCVHLDDAVGLADGQPALRFAVRDTGIGMAPHMQQALFAPFAQGDVSITRQYGGSGLGLAICKRLVEMMGGAIGVHSAPGQGSEFWFKVPLHRVDASQASAPQAMPLPHEAEPAQAWRVLLIEHDAPGHAALMSCLQAAKISAELAQRPEAVAQQLHPNLDAVIVNWGALPDNATQMWQAWLDQLETSGVRLPVLHLVPGPSHQAIVALTSSSPNHVLLFKPLLPGALRKAVGKALHQQGTQTGKRAYASPAQQLQQRGRPLRGQRVLLVEDNPLNQMVAQAFLAQAGLDVTVLDDGAKAVALMKTLPADHFGAILMDMHMPVMDGLEATRCIRQIPGMGGVPVIAMTAAVLPADKALCFEAGMADFVTKPILPESLIDTLLRWMPHLPADPV